ncbi:19682_t:CDS:2 [Dentiscutata erythropus]|uniref:19682_t:CDS:1 n=1 Tax=Dentiscutata erythropus TaxID=1348616 RepID=A0A9N9HUG8_9GLOM|nr:19682_t:CDS:2 [Dentiscutata erythropus]
MPNIAKEICKNIRKVDLKPDDLLSSGILFEGSLRTNQSKLYNILEKKQLIRQLTSDIPTKIELTSDKRLFIEDFMLYEDARFPKVIKSEESYFHELFSFMNAVKKIWKKSSYQNRDPAINERTYSHNFVNSLIEFVFLNTNVEMRWDGSPCQSTKFRDIKGDGPIRYPDMFSYVRNDFYDHSYEFFFAEISYGPFSLDNEDHIGEDFTRLAKFGNDALNHFYFFVKKFQENEQIIKLLDDLKIILVHFYDMKMNVYIMDRNCGPFRKMVPYLTIKLPIIMCDLRKSTDNSINLCEHLNFINSLSIQIISMVNDMVKRRQLLEETKISDNDTITSVFTPES